MDERLDDRYASLSDKEKMDKRKSLIIDIIQSESDFCGELQDFQEYFVDPLMVETDDSIIELVEEPHVAEALKLHQDIVAVTLHLSTNLQTANSGELFAKCFHQFGDENSIALYLRYTEINARVVQIFQSPHYARIIDLFYEDHPLPEGMTVLGALTSPVQHFPSYISNFQEFVWLTPPSRPEIPALLESLAILQTFKQRRASIRMLAPLTGTLFSDSVSGDGKKISSPQTTTISNIVDSDDENNNDDCNDDDSNSSAGASDSDVDHSEDDSNHEVADNIDKSKSSRKIVENGDDSSVGASDDGDNSNEEEEEEGTIADVVNMSNASHTPSQTTTSVDVSAKVEVAVGQQNSEPADPDPLLLAELEGLRSQLRAAEQQISNHNNALASKQKELTKALKDINDCEAEKKLLLVKIKKLGDCNEELQSTNTNLSNELSSTKSELIAMSQALIQAEAQVQSQAASSPGIDRVLSSPKSSGKMGSSRGSFTMGASSRRKSVVDMMVARNSLGYFSDEMDEDEIIRDNLNGLARALNIKQEEDRLYLQLIECMTAEFHLSLSLRSDSVTNSTWITFKGDLAATCRLLLAKVFSFLLGFVNDMHDELIVISTLPYPLQWLLKTFPDVGERSSGRSWLPLHWSLALNEAPSEKEIRLLFEQYGAKTALTQPVSPLSVAVSKSSPHLEMITLLIDLCPELPEHQDADGSFALMHACAWNTSTEVVEYLYETHEEAATTPDNFGCFSIHYACFSGYLPVVQFLLHTCPFLARQKSGNGAFPLHDAVQNYEHGGEDLVRVVYNAHTDAASQPDNNGALPLHHAAKAANLAVVQLIHKAYPAVRKFKLSLLLLLL